MPKRARGDAGRRFDHGSSRGSARGSWVRRGIEACWQRRFANPSFGGGREKTGFVAGWPDPSRGAKTADPVWVERDRGEEDQRDPEVPLLFLGSDPLDDRSGGDPLGGCPPLAGFWHHPPSSSRQRSGRLLGGASSGQRHRRPEGDAGNQGESETRRQVGQSGGARTCARRLDPPASRRHRASRRALAGWRRDIRRPVGADRGVLARHA
jgi:hypothetical protein